MGISQTTTPTFRTLSFIPSPPLLINLLTRPTSLLPCNQQLSQQPHTIHSSLVSVSVSNPPSSSFTCLRSARRRFAVPWSPVTNSALLSVCCSPHVSTTASRNTRPPLSIAGRSVCNSSSVSFLASVSSSSQTHRDTTSSVAGSRRRARLSPASVVSLRILSTSKLNLPRLLPTRSTSVRSSRLAAGSMAG